VNMKSPGRTSVNSKPPICGVRCAADCIFSALQQAFRTYKVCNRYLVNETKHGFSPYCFHIICRHTFRAAGAPIWNRLQILLASLCDRLPYFVLHVLQNVSVNYGNMRAADWTQHMHSAVCQLCPVLNGQLDQTPGGRLAGAA